MPLPRAACWRRRALAASFVPMRDERVAETTQDAVLGGRLALRQPRHGHRVGHDAILLAAATQARPGERAVDLFAGVGAAGLALALRVPRLDVTLVEIDPALVTLARGNLARNDLSARRSACCPAWCSPMRRAGPRPRPRRCCAKTPSCRSPNERTGGRRCGIR